MALGQSLQQKLLQKLSPQQIQLMKLYQIPTAILEERIKEELEENPALEMGDDKENEVIEEEDAQEDIDAEESIEDEEPEEPKTETEAEEEPATEEFDNEPDLSEYILDDEGEIAEYRMKDDNYPEMDDKQTIPIKLESSFFDLVLDQLGMLEFDDRKYKIAEQIVGSLDDDGYLRRELTSIEDDLAFRQNIITNTQEIESIIKQIQQFDPPGVGARDLQECLLIQLKRKQSEGIAVEMAIQVLTKYYDEFIKKHYDKIKKGLTLSDDSLKDVIHQIIKLNPKPGGNIGEFNKAESYIVPDFYIVNNNGILELSLNSKNAPELKISQGYKEMMRQYEHGDKKDKRQKEAVIFIKQKIDSAKWFIEMIQQRQITLMSTMGAIMKHQEDFFQTGDVLLMKPMILKDIAEKTHLDISTVSRVASSKFVQTEFGTYRLKYFFSESISTDSGEEVSTTEVKEILSNMIDAEDKQKPLSDDELTDMLNEKGYNIARRTVAKYREQLNFSVARLRREV